MISQNIQMLAFDLFGVLISEGHLISNGLMHLLPANTDKKKVKTAYENYNSGDINEAEFWTTIGIDLLANKNLRAEFLNSFSLDPQYKTTISLLKKHYRLSILSNFPPDWADNLSKKFQFDHSFEPQIFSGHARCKKPQPEIYQQLIKKTGLAPDQIAFIDDRLENLESAHKSGMTTLYYQREQETHTFKADYKINKLDELVTLFI